MKIQIEIPDNCRDCSCHKELDSTEGGTDYVYHLCLAFNKLLTVSSSSTITGIKSKVNRCKDCIDAEIKEVVEEELSE